MSDRNNYFAQNISVFAVNLIVKYENKRNKCAQLCV